MVAYIRTKAFTDPEEWMYAKQTDGITHPKGRGDVPRVKLGLAPVSGNEEGYLLASEELMSWLNSHQVQIS